MHINCKESSYHWRYSRSTLRMVGWGCCLEWSCPLTYPIRRRRVQSISSWLKHLVIRAKVTL